MDEVLSGIGGNRLRWHQLPTPVRAAIEHALGGRVVSAESQPGGFSPGMASRVRLADGRRAFVKAADAAHAETVRLLRREAQVMSVLPATAPAPELLWCHDDGDWVALGLSDVDGRQPVQPWRRKELDTVLVALTKLAGELTPSPAELAPVAEVFDGAFDGWRRLAGDEQLAATVDSSWARRNLVALAELAASWPTAMAGETLLHADLRADNLLLTGDSVVVVDWPHACVGAAWLDLMFMLPSVAMQGGPRSEVLWRDYLPARDALPAHVDSALAALAGYFVHRSTLPPPPGVSRVREFQRVQGVAALDWLRARID